jgi:hypothetical protein
MNPVLRTEVSSGRPPMPLHLLLILLGRKLLISKRYSRDSSYSRLVTTNKSSCTRGSAGAYARAYKGLALHPAEPAEPAGILFLNGIRAEGWLLHTLPPAGQITISSWQRTHRLRQYPTGYG